MTRSMEDVMQEVILVTTKSVLKAKAKKIGETLVRAAANGCAAFGQDRYRQHVELAGPGLIEMALDLAEEAYVVTDDSEEDQALAFFELGVSRLTEQVKSEGLDRLI